MLLDIERLLVQHYATHKSLHSDLALYLFKLCALYRTQICTSIRYDILWYSCFCFSMGSWSDGPNNANISVLFGTACTACAILISDAWFQGECLNYVLYCRRYLVLANLTVPLRNFLSKRLVHCHLN